MENNKIYVNKKLVGDASVSELDFVLHEEFGFDYDEHDDFVELTEGHGDADACPIKIDQMIAILTDLKSRGATHVQIEYHCDHIGYDISGFEITLASEEKVKDLEEKKKKAREKQEKIDALQAQINDLRSVDIEQPDADNLPF